MASACCHRRGPTLAISGQVWQAASWAPVRPATALGTALHGGALKRPRTTRAKGPPPLPGRLTRCSLGGVDGFTAVVVAASCTGMVASIANRRPVDSSQSAAGGEGRASFGWGLAGFLSLVPLANWSAWLVAAQLEEEEEQGESSPVVCYAFAVLYALPIFHNGIVPDVTDAVMLALGALHLQVERVAQSEPSALHALPNLQNGGGKLFSTVTKTASSTVINLGKKLETRQSLGESDNEATSDELEEYTEAELKAFDDKLRQSSSAKTGEARRKPSSGAMIIEDSREREQDDA